MRHYGKIVFNNRRRSSYPGRVLVGLLFMLSIPHVTLAKQTKRFSFPFRKYCSYVQFSLSTGFGVAFYKNIIHNVQIREEKGRLYIRSPQIQDNGPTYTYLINWYHGPYVLLPGESQKESEDLKTDNTSSFFAGKGYTIPIVLSSYVDWQRLRVGVGGSWSIHILTHLQHYKKQEDSTNYVKTDTSYKPTQKLYHELALLFIAGLKIQQNATYSTIFVIHWEPGMYYSKWRSQRCVYFRPVQWDIGVNFERQWSDYFKIVSRLSYKTVPLARDLTDSNNTNWDWGVFCSHHFIRLQLGVSFNLPEVSRCRIANCRIKMKHRHNGKYYQRRSFFKKRQTGINNP